MVELAQLFQDMDAAVIEQEPAVANVEGKTEETVVNLDQGNKHLDGAVVKARSARKKKWICFWIVGKLIYVVLLSYLRARSLMLPSAHRHYHWGGCWRWCWSDRWGNEEGYWDLTTMSLDCTHSPTVSHATLAFSFHRLPRAYEPHLILALEDTAPDRRYRLPGGRLGLAASLPIIFRLHF